MLFGIFILLLVICAQLGSSENCEKIDWLQPFTNESNFACSSSGWYPNKDDKNCRQYFVCIKNKMNFITLYMKCPFGKYFDPKTNECNPDYLCPYSLQTTTPTTEVEVATDETIDNNESEKCIYEPSPNYFSCKLSGKFPNFNDVTCGSYFYCVVIIDPILIVETKYSCDENSFFNPKTQICEQNYKCPCSKSSEIETTTITSSTYTSSLYTTIEKSVTTPNQNNGITKNIISTSTDKSTTIQNNTTNPTFCNQKNKSIFNCFGPGNFTNHNDITCKSYYTCEKCTLLWDFLSYEPIANICPSNTLYNPILRACDTMHICPFSRQNSTEITTENIFSTTYPTMITSNQINETLTTTATSVTDRCNYNADSEYFTCTERGRFKNANDLTCSSYYLCSILFGGIVIKTKYYCPSKSYFNPTKELCDVDYVCPCASVTNTTQIATVTPEKDETNEESSSKSESDDSSSRSDDYSNEDSSNESTTSKTTAKTEITPSKITPRSTPYSNTSQNASEITSTTKANECDYIADSEYFTCTKRGRFKNANDVTCSSYYLCSILFGGIVIKTEYSCPPKSYFNPTKELCDMNYICPCASVTTTTQTTIITTEKYETDKESSSESESNDNTRESNDTGNEHSSNETFTRKTTAVETTETTYSVDSSTLTVTTQNTNAVNITSTTIRNKCDYIEDSGYFSCTIRGRFRNANDITCRSYYLCSILSTGRVITTKYYCPSQSYFNPTKGLCDTDYVCPCSAETAGTLFTTVTAEKYNTDEEKSSESDFDDSSNESNDTSSRENSSERETDDIIIESDDASNTDSTDNSHETITSKTSTNITSTTIESDCNYIADSPYFTCTETGKFRNANDLTCSSYYLCIVLGSGRIVQTKYTCPSSTYFNPTTQLCDMNYVCPCTSVTTTTHISTVKTEEDKLKDESSSESEPGDSSRGSDETNNTDNSNESITSKTSTTIANECDYIADSAYFTCTETGKFRNANDLTCSSYYRCIVLGSGRIVQTKYTCPSSTYFNPTKQLCDMNYVCPCTSVTTTTEITTVETEEDEIDHESNFDGSSSGSTGNSSTVNSNESITSETTTNFTSTTTASESNYNADSAYFTCTETGKFRNANDLTCSSYYLCIVLGSRGIVQTKYTCPSSTYFNPTKQLCDMNYVCPCTSVTTTTHIATVKTEEGKIADESSSESYFDDSSTGSNDISSTDNSTGNESDDSSSESDETSNTDNSNESVTSTTTTNITSSTIASECVYNTDPAYFTCTETGNFRNANDLTCSSYYLCIVFGSRIIVQTKYTCPSSTYFNPTKQLCVMNYVCPCTSVTTTTHITTVKTEEDKVNDESSSESEPDDSSRGSDETSNTENSNESITSKTSTSITSTTIASECDYIADSAYFTCNETGKFRNANDLTCSSYYLCIVFGSRIIVQTKYTCPSLTYFNPTKQLCDMNYVCRCTSVTATTHITTVKTEEDKINDENSSESEPDDSSSGSNDSSSADNSNESITTKTTTNITSTTIASECVYNADPAYFTCTETGKFRNANDLTCSSYYRCIGLGSVRIVQTKYTCPTLTFFNPAIQLCDMNYVCPCTSVTTSTHIATVKIEEGKIADASNLDDSYSGSNDTSSTDTSNERESDDSSSGSDTSSGDSSNESESDGSSSGGDDTSSTDSSNESESDDSSSG